jgi:hypothetical protein
MDESSNIQNRRSRRSNVLLAASIESGGATLDVKLRNLSEQGALIVAESLPVEGSEVVFCRNDLRVRSRIAWVHGKNAGIAFHVPLEPQEVLRNIPKPRKAMQPNFRRPGLACQALTPQQQKLADTWLTAAPLGSLGE